MKWWRGIVFGMSVEWMVEDGSCEGIFLEVCGMWLWFGLDLEFGVG